MNEPFVTLQGWVGNDVAFRETKDGPVANFRVGVTPRIRRRDAGWVDGPTSWFSVSCWRLLAENVRDSVRKGDAVVVHGRLRTDVWERQDGQSSTTYVLDAQHVGHDLNRGTTMFTRVSRQDRADGDDDGEREVKALLHSQVDDLPQLDSQGNVVGQRQSPAA